MSQNKEEKRKILLSFIKEVENEVYGGNKKILEAEKSQKTDSKEKKETKTSSTGVSKDKGSTKKSDTQSGERVSSTKNEPEKKATSTKNVTKTGKETVAKTKAVASRASKKTKQDKIEDEGLHEADMLTDEIITKLAAILEFVVSDYGKVMKMHDSLNDFLEYVGHFVGKQSSKGTKTSSGSEDISRARTVKLTDK